MASSLKQPQEHDKTGKVEVTILASEWRSSKGGLSTIIRELAIQLAKFPYVKVTFFLPKCSHEDKKEGLTYNVSIVEAQRRPGYEELDWLSFPPQHLQIDVVIGHCVKLGRQAQIIREYHKCKWVQVVDTDPEELGSFNCYENPVSKGEQKHRVEVELCQMADLVVGVGPKLTEAFRKYLGCCKKDKDVFEFTPGVFADFGSVKQVPVKRKHCSVLVCGCGDVEDFELKGFDIVARSVAALPDSHLVFVGAPEGKHKEITEHFLGLGIPENCLIVKGYMEREALKRLFCEVDLVLMPSRTEGFGLTGLEGLSAGLPVIVSKNSGFGEALGGIPFGSSFVIDSEDPSAWTAAIKGILNKDRQMQLDESRVLRDFYERRYSWSEQCKNLLKKVANLLENKPAEEEPVEDTTQTQHEETTEDAPSDDEIWQEKEVANREMKKKKQKQHFKEVEKRSSEEQVDLMESYTDKPVEEKVDFPPSMGGPAQYPPPQAIQGQFPPVSCLSQPQGHLTYQSATGFTMGQPPVCIVTAPAPQVSQFQAQTTEPCAGEKKIIQIKDPNSNKDVTQESFEQKPAGSLASTAAGTSNVTPNLSGQSSNSSTPPLTSQQQAEANVRGQFAAQVAATLVKNSEEKPKKIELAVQKSNANSRADVDSSKAREPVDAQKEEALNGPKKNDLVTNATEKASETELKEATVTAKSQSKEDESSNSGEIVLGPKSLVGSVDAASLANEKSSSIIVEIFTVQEVPKRESTKISAPVVSDKIKLEEIVKPDESEKPVATDALPVSESKTLNGPTTVSYEQGEEETEKMTAVSSEVEVETAPDAAAAVAPEPSKAPEDDDTTRNEEPTQGSEESEVLPSSSEVEEASGMEKVTGHDGEGKVSALSKIPIDSQSQVATKETKKKKQKQHIEEIEKRSSEKEMDMMAAHTDKPVQEKLTGPGQLPQNIVMHPMPSHMQGPQARLRHPTQQFYHGIRSMRIPRAPPPGNRPVYSSPPGGPMVQMLAHTGRPQFTSPGQPNQFIAQHVDFPVSMGGPARYPPPQAIQGQFPSVPGPSQPQGHLIYQSPTGFPMGQAPLYIVRAPAPGMSQFQLQTIEPRAREKKIIQVKDPNSSKDVTQEILKQKPVGFSASTVAGTPSVTPNLSGQSSNSSTPPLTSQQQAEAKVRAQFAAQVAATSVKNPEKKSGEIALRSKSLVSSLDATKLANEKIHNVLVEVFTAQEVPKRESTKISAPVVSDVVKTEEIVKPDESEKPVATDALLVSDSKTKVPVDSQSPVAAKEMKKKKQKQRFKEIEKRCLEKEMDVMKAYTDKPVQEHVSDQAEEEPVEDTTQMQHEEMTEDALSDHETIWGDKEDSWSPDLEDASDAKPDGAKLTYSRDFLLQFQTHPLCMLKPEGLPDIDIVLLQARAPSKSGSQQNRMHKGDAETFLPAFMQQTSKLKRVDNRWVRPSEATKGGSEEEARTQELFCKVKRILSKLTPQNFQTLTQQITDLNIDTQERLEGAIDLILAKATDEATFSAAIANMCQSLVRQNKKVVVEEDGIKKEISFRKILLNRCQKEFEKENTLEKTINEKLRDLVNQGLSEEELQERKSDLEDQVHQAKRRTLGNIQFIGELFKLKMLTEGIMHDCVVKLLRSNDEESFECLCKLLVTIGADLDHEKAKPRVDQYFNQISKIILAKVTSSRVRFIMQDVVDLRNNNWVPRLEDSYPKTVDQIHREAADQEKKTRLKIQMAKQEKKLQRGNMGGRDGPRPGSIPQADESWTTVGRGPRIMHVDPKKFQNLKRQVDSRNMFLGEGGRGYGSWARVNSWGTGAVAASAVLEVTKETMKKKTLSIIDEFLIAKDMKEVAECLKEIQSPSRHHVFVEVTFNHTMEKRTSERQLTGKLIHFLLRDGVLTAQQYLDGLNSVFEVAEDTEIEQWKYLGELMGPTAFDGSLGLDVLFKCVFKHVQKHKAARLFASMVKSCEKSQEDVRAFLRTYNFNLNIFFDDAGEAREFAKYKNIEYALGPASPSSRQYSAKGEEELRNIILKRKARNEEVMDWIDENVHPLSRKETPFIRGLVTIVCEGALDEEGEVCKCNIHKLKERKNLLQKHIDANTDLEVQALYAVQALYLRLGHPPGFVKSYFDSLYDEEIITKVSFNTWESSMDEEPGKGVTVMAASEFFRWLRSATEENDVES